MAELIELKEEEERVILFAVSTGNGDDARDSLEELEELAQTAGAVTVSAVTWDFSAALSSSGAMAIAWGAAARGSAVSPPAAS